MGRGRCACRTGLDSLTNEVAQISGGVREVLPERRNTILDASEATMAISSLDKKMEMLQRAFVQQRSDHDIETIRATADSVHAEIQMGRSANAKLEAAGLGSDLENMLSKVIKSQLEVPLHSHRRLPSPLIRHPLVST